MEGDVEDEDIENKDIEIWKQIINSNPIPYEISNKGRIRNKKSERILKKRIINGYYITFLKNDISNFGILKTRFLQFFGNPKNNRF